MDDNKKIQKQHFYFGTVDIHFRVVQIVFQDVSRTEVNKVSLEPWCLGCRGEMAHKFVCRASMYLLCLWCALICTLDSDWI